MFGSTVVNAWQDALGLWNISSSVISLSMKAAAAIIQTDTNNFVTMICLLMMNAFNLVALIYILGWGKSSCTVLLRHPHLSNMAHGLFLNLIFRIVTSSYVCIVTASLSDATTWLMKIVALLSLLMLLMAIYPVIDIFIHMIYLLPATALYIGGLLRSSWILSQCDSAQILILIK